MNTITKNNILSLDNGINQSRQLLMSQNINKFAPVALLTILTIILLYFGVVQQTIAESLALSLVFISPYAIFKYVIKKDKISNAIMALSLSALSLLVNIKSEGQMFNLLFIATAVTIFYKEIKLIWIPSILLLATILILELSSVSLSHLNHHLLINTIFFIGYTIICFILTERLSYHVAKQKEYSEKFDDLEKKEGHNINFAKEIAAGNFEAVISPSKEDVLGQSLLEMSNNLKKAAQIEKERTWQIEGIAQVHDIIRLYNSNLEEMCFQVVTNLVKYIKANQAGIFILNSLESENPKLELKACYAYNRQKFLKKEVEIGEGLLGQTYLEKEPIYLTQIPEGYFSITSGLGDATPKSLYIIPLKVEDKVVGVLEIASFSEIPVYVRNFLEKASESIASAILSLIGTEQTNKLLAQSQELAEQLRSQEEEVRQNLEELNATQEDLHRKNLEREKAEQEAKEAHLFLNGVLDAIPAPIYVKDKDHQILLANQAYYNTVKSGSYTLSASSVATKGGDMFIEEDENAFITHSTEKSEKIIEHAENKTYYLSTKAFFKNQKNEDLLINILFDITERKESEEALALEKLMFQSLMDNFPDRINFKDKNGKYLRVNKSKAKRHGLDDPSLIIGKSDFDYFAKEHAQKAFNEELEIMTSGKAKLNIEEKLAYSDGAISWGLTSKMPLINENGEVIGTYGITQDISQRKVLEYTIENQKRIINDVTDKLPVFFYQIDKERKFTNATGLTFYNLSLSELIGKKAATVIPIEENVKTLERNEEVRFTQKVRIGKSERSLHHLLFENKCIEGGLMGFAFPEDIQHSKKS